MTNDLTKARLQQAIDSASSIRAEHRAQLEPHAQRRHVRPTAGGLTLVSIVHEYAQVGEAFGSIEPLLAALANEYKIPGKSSPEKQLQSALIRDAYHHGRHLRALEEASKGSDESVELLFVTDELALPRLDEPRIVCDILALRVDGGLSRPVAIELKSSRDKMQLIKQVDGYAKLIEENRDEFARFYGAVLGRDVRFDAAPVEKWIVWPKRTKPAESEPHEDSLRQAGIRVVTYAGDGPEYSFRVGNSVTR